MHDRNAVELIQRRHVHVVENEIVGLIQRSVSDRILAVPQHAHEFALHFSDQRQEGFVIVDHEPHRQDVHEETDNVVFFERRLWKGTPMESSDAADAMYVSCEDGSQNCKQRGIRRQHKDLLVARCIIEHAGATRINKLSDPDDAVGRFRSRLAVERDRLDRVSHFFLPKRLSLLGARRTQIFMLATHRLMERRQRFCFFEPAIEREPVVILNQTFR